MENLPQIINLVFGLTTLLTVLIFFKASGNSKIAILILIAWLVLQAIIGLLGFYTVTDTLPPRIFILVIPPLLSILLLFVTSGGRKFIDKLNLKTLTILHTVRIPVELVLYWLYINKAVPQLMTFEGRNYDILAGLSAPFVYYFGFISKLLGKKIILYWNLICLGLLINIVVNAVFSLPYPFQKFAYDQPNIAVLYFPFNWLPSVIVPLVLFAHLASIRQLLNQRAVSVSDSPDRII